jgi:hypothetical protein
MVLQQPIDAVIGTTAFFVCRERHEEVAIGGEALPLVADEIGDPDRRLGLVVTRASAVEVAFSRNWNGSVLQLTT